MSPEIRKVVDRARREPEGRFHSLAHLLDVPALAAAYWSIRKDAAVGVDGVTKDQYGQDVEQNLQDLYARLRSKRYWHQPIRRVHIPKDGCFRHQLLLPRPYLVLTKPLRLDIQCQRGASAKIGWKYLDD